MGVIYCLFSSSDGVPRYVGKTTREPDRRWKEHIACALNKDETGTLYDWIRDVLRRGNLVQYWVLQEDITPVELDTFESYWIGQFADLINCSPECNSSHSTLGLQIQTAIKEQIKREHRRKA